jgi:hypothetical protein
LTDEFEFFDMSSLESYGYSGFWNGIVIFPSELFDALVTHIQKPLDLPQFCGGAFMEFLWLQRDGFRPMADRDLSYFFANEDTQENKLRELISILEEKVAFYEERVVLLRDRLTGHHWKSGPLVIPPAELQALRLGFLIKRSDLLSEENIEGVIMRWEIYIKGDEQLLNQCLCRLGELRRHYEVD